jgi:hypothetical protein
MGEDDVKSMPEHEVTELLKKFSVEVRQKNGNPYSKQSLKSMRSGINRYLHRTVSP